MAKRSDEEIKKEIVVLKSLQGRIRPYSMFGDDNNTALRATIQVLENDMDGGDIYEEWNEGKDENEYILSSALDTLYWRDNDDGSGAEPPSEGWKLLLKKEE